MNSSPCPLCNSISNRIFQTHDYWVRDCQKCGHRFAEIEIRETHLEEVYSDRYFIGGGAGYSDYLSEAHILEAAGHRYGKLVAKYAGATGTVLDIGTAAGFILRGFEQAGWQGRGVEPNASMSEFARKNLHLNIENISVEDFCTNEKFDLISLIQVVAHLESPSKILKKLAQMTKSGGHLLIETWRRDSLTARIFGRNWHEHSPPSVLHWFTKPELQKLAEDTGYDVVASGRPSKWISASHAKSLLTFKLKQTPFTNILSPVLSVIPDKLQFPYPAEDLFWLLARKND